ncbi:hypothetical protein LEMLEM_LOCUS8859, partial [Lemmus lemmus]
IRQAGWGRLAEDGQAWAFLTNQEAAHTEQRAHLTSTVPPRQRIQSNKTMSGCSGSLGLPELRCPESKAAEGGRVSGVQQGQEECNRLRSELCGSQQGLGSCGGQSEVIGCSSYLSLPTCTPTLIHATVKLISGTKPVLGG